MRVVVSEFVTVDGVFEDPGGVEGFTHGGWAFRYDRGPGGDRFKLEEILEVGETLLVTLRRHQQTAQAATGVTQSTPRSEPVSAG
jgi:hypothetical protein